MDEKRTIYIVEDEPELREILEEALEHVGYTTKSAPDGKSLLDLVSGDAHPDLILMDIGLPDMTGWDLQKKLQDDPAVNQIPVIAVTGYGGASVEHTALKTLHFADFIRKPYSLADLMNRIEAVMDKSAQPQAEH